MLFSEVEGARLLTINSFSRDNVMYGIQRWHPEGPVGEPEWLKVKKRYIMAVGIPEYLQVIENYKIMCQKFGVVKQINHIGTYSVRV